MQHQFASMAKKIALLILSLLMVLVYAACGETPPQSQVNVTPTPAPSKMVFAVTKDKVVALQVNDGKEVWSVDSSSTGGRNRSQIAVSDNLLFWNDSSTSLVALETATGKQHWNQSLSSSASQMAATKDSLYLVAGSQLYAFDAKSGDLKWRVEVDSETSEQVFMLHNNVIYTKQVKDESQDNSAFVALNAQDGKELWTFTPAKKGMPEEVEEELNVGHMLLSKDGKLLVLGYGGAAASAVVVIIDVATHQELWRLERVEEEKLYGMKYYNHALDAELLYLTANNRLIVNAVFEEEQEQCKAFNLMDGKELWKAEGIEEPVVGEEGIFAITGPTQGDVTAISLETGSQLWSKPGTGEYEKLVTSNNVLLAQTSGGAVDVLGVKDGKTVHKFPEGSAEGIRVLNDTFYFIRGDSSSSYSSGEPILEAINAQTGRVRWEIDLSSSIVGLQIA